MSVASTANQMQQSVSINESKLGDVDINLLDTYPQIGISPNEIKLSNAQCALRIANHTSDSATSSLPSNHRQSWPVCHDNNSSFNNTGCILPKMAPTFISPMPILRTSQRHNKCPYRAPKMSGVNGGIDYTIDLSTLPKPLSKQIEMIQQGPDSPTALIEAAEDIATASITYPETIPVLVDMLGFNNPVAARVAIDALVRAGGTSVPHLLTGVAAFNYSVNAYALRALARIGDPSVAVVALECAKKGPIPNVRRAACQTLAGLRYGDSGEASMAWGCLVDLVEGEPDWGVRYAAIVALERFLEVDSLDDEAVERGLNVVEKTSNDFENDATVRARAYVAYEEMSHLRKRAFTTASKKP